MQSSYLHRHNQSAFTASLNDSTVLGGRAAPQINQGTSGQLNSSGSNLIKSYDSTSLPQRAQASLSIVGGNNGNYSTINHTTQMGPIRDN